MTCSYVERFVALHDNAINDQLVFGKGDVGRKEKVAREFGGMPHDQINKIREHYGDEVGWYYAWATHYIQWLFVPAIVGLLVQVGFYEKRTQWGGPVAAPPAVGLYRCAHRAHRAPFHPYSVIN